MLIIAGPVKCQADDVEAACAGMTEMMRHSQAEDGCVSYVFTQDMADPTLFHLFEEWDSHEHLAAHGASDHMKVFQARIAELGAMERDISIYDASNKKPLG